MLKGQARTIAAIAMTAATRKKLNFGLLDLRILSCPSNPVDFW